MWEQKALIVKLHQSELSKQFEEENKENSQEESRQEMLKYIAKSLEHEQQFLLSQWQYKLYLRGSQNLVKLALHRIMNHIKGIKHDSREGITKETALKEFQVYWAEEQRKLHSLLQEKLQTDWGQIHKEVCGIYAVWQNRTVGHTYDSFVLSRGKAAIRFSADSFLEAYAIKTYSKAEPEYYTFLQRTKGGLSPFLIPLAMVLWTSG